MGAEGEMMYATDHQKGGRDWVSKQYEIALNLGPCELHLRLLSKTTQKGS